jgi:hypothetical protein
MRAWALRAVFVVLAALGGVGVARAAPDCSGGPQYVAIAAVSGYYASDDAACDALAPWWGVDRSACSALPGHYLSLAVPGYGEYIYPLVDMCSASALGTGGAGGGGSVTFPDIFNISPEGGAEIAAAVVAIWSIAYAFRMLIRSVSSGGVSSTSESE